MEFEFGGGKKNKTLEGCLVYEKRECSGWK
jgi:hypothetical protein